MNKTLLVASLLSLTTVSASAFAGGTEACCSSTAKVAADKPVPVDVVAVTQLPRDFQPQVVEVALTIDENGQARDVKTLGFVDRKVSSRVVAAVSQWRFKPSTVDGKPVAGRYVLPLDIVESSESFERMAAKNDASRQ